MKVTHIDHMGSDLTVVNAARVSFGKQSDWVYSQGGTGPVCLSESDANLIQYLGDHGHISPFGHCFATFHVKAPIFVARQLVKHKFLRWNEISRRYVDYEPEFYYPTEWRARPDSSIKQGSGESIGDWTYKPSSLDCLEEYNMLLERNVAPEMARMVLPQNMYTEWYWSGSLDAFASMCNLRCSSDAQLESRMIADDIDEDMRALFPLSWEALRET